MSIIAFPRRPSLPRTLLKDGWWLVAPVRAAKIYRFPQRVGSEAQYNARSCNARLCTILPFPLQPSSPGAPRPAIGAIERVG